MKRVFSILGLAILTACGGGGSGSSSSSGPSEELEIIPPLPAPVAPSVVENNSFASLLNDVRIDNGASSVTYDNRLATAAVNHANDMYVNDYFSHDGLNGSTPRSRALDEGYNAGPIGENIAQGQTSQQQVMNAWTNSTTGHHENNINPVYEDFGLGKAGSGGETRWVLVLATEK